MKNNLTINVNAKPLISHQEQSIIQIILLNIVMMNFPYHTQVIILSILLLKPKNSNVISPRHLLALLENKIDPSA